MRIISNLIFLCITGEDDKMVDLVVCFVDSVAMVCRDDSVGTVLRDNSQSLQGLRNLI